MELAYILSASLLAAVAYDAAIGERPLRTHPVLAFGSVISFLEPRLNVGSSRIRKVVGGLMLIIVLCICASLYPVAIRLAYRCIGHSAYGMIAVALIMTYCIKTSFAIRAMNSEAHAVTAYVRKGDMGAARTQVSYIVSRPTGGLDREGILSATVECVGESVVDGVISPLFYAVVAGVYGCLGYRAINTADSRVGYRSERYQHFGMPAARLDDVLNYLPARLAVMETIIAACMLRMNVKRGVAIWRRDRSATSSPNAGHTMALYAGLLGVRLTKAGHYTLGDPTVPLAPEHVDRACHLLNATSVVHAVLCSIAIAALPLPVLVV